MDERHCVIILLILPSLNKFLFDKQLNNTGRSPNQAAQKKKKKSYFV
jgi:hypothetical protein